MHARLERIGYDLTPNISIDKRKPKCKYGVISAEVLNRYNPVEGTLVSYLKGLGYEGLHIIEPNYLMDDLNLRELYNSLYKELPSDIYYSYNYGERLNVAIMDINKVSFYKDCKGIRHHYYTPQLFGSLCMVI